MDQKQVLLAGMLLLLTFSTIAQQSQKSLMYNYVTEKRKLQPSVPTIQLFEKSSASNTVINATVSAKQLLLLKKFETNRLFSTKPADLSISIPAEANGVYQLELVQENISHGDLQIGKLVNGKPEAAGISTAVHYRGYIAGDAASIASVSIFSDGEIMCLFSNAAGNFNVGKIKGSDTYLLYNSNNMLAPLGFECSTDQLPVIGTTNSDNFNTNVPVPAAAPVLLCKKVTVYWEGSYKLYANNFGSDFNATSNYLTGVFNQVATMFQNEGILIQLTDTYIWTTQDPYNTNTSSNALSTLRNRWNMLGNNFKADICLLVDGGPTNNGGIAYLLNDLCFRAYAYGYANVYASYATVPTYSWDVEVLTHEMGHILGSHHTHWCGWNTGAGGACGAIDNCYPVETAGNCSTCNAVVNTNPSAPGGFKGSVMSYCHLRQSIGINLSNGFGTLPQATIRNSVNFASCLKLDNKWTGLVSTEWENAINWSCGSIPTIKTDVTIGSRVTYFPEINSQAVCRKIVQQSSTSVIVNPGFSLVVAGLPE